MVFLAVAVGVGAIACMINGYVLSVLWGWFIIPTFGLPALSIPAAIGIALVAGLLTHQLRTENKDKGEYEDLLRLVVMCIAPFFTLLVGWIVKGFM